MPPNQTEEAASVPSTTASTARTRTRMNAIFALYTHRALFDDIGLNNRPEGDIRQRYPRYRAIRAQYAEYRVGEAGSAYDEFMSEIEVGKHLDELASTSISKRFEEIMDNLDRELQRVSRIFDEDGPATHGPIPSRYFMDNMVRTHTEGKILAPNGESLSMYGSIGESVSPTLLALRECEDGLLQNFILDRIICPFHSRIYLPYRKLFLWITFRGPEPEPQGLSGRTVELVVTAVECAILVSCLAGSVALLDQIESARDGIIAASFFSLALPYVAVLLSTKARNIFTWIYASWAVMVVFIATSGSGSKCK